jgi:1,2-diacylglycerol-3-alpha-glucose alpha-1,2-glucosyltransferase
MMKVCLYLESLEKLMARRGMRTAFRTVFRHQKRALKLAGIDVTTDPNDNYDILHLHCFGPQSLYLLRRAKRRGIKVVVHAHSIGSYDVRDSLTFANKFAPVYEHWLRFFYSQADYIFSPSGRARELLQSQGLERIAVVSNGIDRQRFRFSAEKREEFRRRFGLTRFTVYSAGSLIPRKGVVEFLDVARALPKFDFIWYGYRVPKLLTFYPKMLRKIARRPANVVLPGFIRDTQGAFSAGDLFLFPTLGENQPLVVLEAAALGRPMILRDLPEFRGWLEDGINCLKGQTVEEFAGLVERVANDEKLRIKLAQGSEALAEEHRLERVGERLKYLYEMVLNEVNG